MKKFFLIISIFFFSCEKSENLPTTYNSIEGKWLAQGTVPEGNTMYLYENGVRYTYYCVEGDCNSLYNSYKANDGNPLPSSLNYTFENDILTVDLNFGSELVTPVTFECDGGKMFFTFNEQTFYRLNSDCN